jgi:hypothetical protein
LMGIHLPFLLSGIRPNSWGLKRYFFQLKSSGNQCLFMAHYCCVGSWIHVKQRGTSWPSRLELKSGDLLSLSSQLYKQDYYAWSSSKVLAVHTYTYNNNLNKNNKQQLTGHTRRPRLRLMTLIFHGQWRYDDRDNNAHSSILPWWAAWRYTSKLYLFLNAAHVRTLHAHAEESPPLLLFPSSIDLRFCFFVNVQATSRATACFDGWLMTVAVLLLKSSWC